MKILDLAIAALVVVAIGAQPALADDCHPEIDLQQPQYTLGYGSLMEDQSKRRTVANAGPNLPVRVTGYRRGWIDPGRGPGPQTTYLGIRPEQGASMNAALYLLPDRQEIAHTDAREYVYCRHLVPRDRVTMLDGKPLPDGQVWVYVTPAANLGAPSPETPIVQSYVDIFIHGCLEMEDRYQLPGFAAECITSTHGWSPHWVNDRIYPRRPFIYRPAASRIDRLLQAHLPAIFPQIRIE
ncbi:MAG: gamma-glutamylcyclotransferase family protein [Sneathiellaceae bacterium]